ncbi:MAG: metallophosphoesterase family protein [Desulfatibacillaceae bacterium]
MRFGIFSDVRSKDRELEVVLDRLVDCDLLFNLGDVVGYHGDVNRCIRLLDTPRTVNLLGDTDREVFAKSGPADAERPGDYGVSEANKEIMRGFRAMRKFKVKGRAYGFTHGHMVHEGDGPASMDRAEYYNAIEMFHGMGCSRIFTGHSCVPRVLLMDRHAIIHEEELYETTRVDFDPECSYIIDVGSAARRCYAVLHFDDDCVVIHYEK